MKYIKYTICIMIVVSVLSFCKTNAIGIGQLTINFVGNVETGEHQKKTENPQYARKTSCYGTLTGSNLNTAARANLATSPSTYGDWIELGSVDRELTGEKTKISGRYYTLGLKVTNSIESCYFVGSWTIN